MKETHFAATTRLARRVLDGEVVFFVGAGFSLDSEGNTATRLVARLLAGMLAMGAVLVRRQTNQARGVLDGLGRVFGLEGAKQPGDAAREPARCMTRDNLDRLSREYYSFNDWSVSALGVLSEDLLSLPDTEQLEQVADMRQLGNFLLSLVGDSVPFDPIEWKSLRRLPVQGARGKALFLDLMGFANCDIMAGDPRSADTELVALSYGERLRPRHHALARMAREGLAAATVTTNYDLLLEGAYRLAGFSERTASNDQGANNGSRNIACTSSHGAQYSIISGADQFFARGTGYRTALLLKIHGCAQAYREARQRQLTHDAQATAVPVPNRNAWAVCLPALVFTYREIQTWRGDAWSRDLIRTYLRTHTIALCGYSGADPVMHSTFREVFEEKALANPPTAPHACASESPERETSPAPASAPIAAAHTSELPVRETSPPIVPRTLDLPLETELGAENASVFYFAITKRREFHSLEILRAATAAAGLPPIGLLEHPNQIEFALSPGFPCVDDHFRWLTHYVLRELQREAVEKHLRRLVPRLLQRDCRDRELQIVKEAFEAVRARELGELRAICALTPERGAECARRFDGIVDWTWHFLPGLLREFALADSVDQRQGAGELVRSWRTPYYYHPASAHPEWTAWSVVVELALRRLVASLDESRDAAGTRLVAEESPHAAVSFSIRGDQWSRFALCIRLCGFDRPGRAPAIRGAFQRVSFWDFWEKDVPWPLEPREPCPTPRMLWGFATGNAPPTQALARRHLGISP